MEFEKYKKNLKYENGAVYSYETKVAYWQGENLVELGHWSATTRKHVNYAARELNLKVLHSFEKIEL